MPKRHRQLSSGISELDEEENRLFQGIEQRQLERRHAWKGWLTYLGIIVITGTVFFSTHPLIGIGTFFFLIYLGKDFDPIPKNQRFYD